MSDKTQHFTITVEGEVEFHTSDLDRSDFGSPAEELEDAIAKAVNEFRESWPGARVEINGVG